MKKCLLLLLAVLFLARMDRQSFAQTELSNHAPELRSQRTKLSQGWNMIGTRGKTTCALSTPYSFFYRPGTDSSKLMIYFQGGGACWDWVSCQGLFDSSVERDELNEYKGIFDFSNPENPIANYHIVFIPYCTADVHIGNAAQKYGTTPGQNGSIEHRGFVNTSAVLHWVYENFASLQTIFLTGSSAGSYAAIFYAPYIMSHYPGARVVELGDCGVALLHNYQTILAKWGMFNNMPKFIAKFYRATPENFTLNLLYTATANKYRDNVFAMITTDHDNVQSAFYLISGSHEWRTRSYALIDTLEKELPNFRTFIAGGSEHTLLPRQAFYTCTVEGVLLRDWVTDLLAGRKVKSIRCKECATAELQSK